MIKRMIFMLIAVGVVLGLVFGFQSFKGVMVGKAWRAWPSPP